MKSLTLSPPANDPSRPAFPTPFHAQPAAAERHPGHSAVPPLRELPGARLDHAIRPLVLLEVPLQDSVSLQAAPPRRHCSLE